MKNFSEKDKSGASKEDKAGYYMYADGHSYWGVSLYKNCEIPKLCTAEMHKEKSVAEKAEWYAEQNAKKK